MNSPVAGEEKAYQLSYQWICLWSLSLNSSLVPETFNIVMSKIATPCEAGWKLAAGLESYRRINSYIKKTSVCKSWQTTGKSIIIFKYVCISACSLTEISGGTNCTPPVERCSQTCLWVLLIWQQKDLQSHFSSWESLMAIPIELVGILKISSTEEMIYTSRVEKTHVNVTFPLVFCRNKPLWLHVYNWGEHKQHKTTLSCLYIKFSRSLNEM